MRKAILFLILSVISILTYAQANCLEPAKLIFFYSPTCHACIEVKSQVMPEIEKEFKDRIIIEYRDISDIQNYKLLLGLRQQNKLETKITVPTCYFQGRFFVGKKEITDNLKETITKTLHLAQKEGIPPEIDLIAWFGTFTPLVIIGAGLIDGINPCAFTVIVFFISFLALQGYRKLELIIIGATFILAVFLTYLLMGLGLFGFLYRLEGFWQVIKIFNLSIGVFSIIMGCLALYDLFVYQKTKETEGLLLQLPKPIKNRIHNIIGLYHRRQAEEKQTGLTKSFFRLIISAFITGFLVSLLEAVCTGQTYLPTIGFVLKNSHLKIEAFSYLLLYNLMFIAPLVLIFIFAMLGVSSEQFSKFLKKHLSIIKILIAALFFGLGIFLIWRT
jgi:cytochrome c biogenesis protein CcdA